MPFKLTLEEHQEKMKLLVVLCLLSAAVALPTQEQLHTNLPAPPSPPELKSEEKDKGSHEPNPHTKEVETFDDFKNPSDSAEKPKSGKDENKDKPEDIKLIEKDSKESKESKDSKEKSKESQEFKEPWESKEIEEPKQKEEPKEIEEPKEEKKDSKSDESKEEHEEDGPVVVEVVKGPSLSDFFSQWFPNFHFPWSFPYFRSKFRSGDQQEDQPVYIVRQSDFDFN